MVGGLTRSGQLQYRDLRPGAEHLYCNTGYTLLATIVKRVSGQTFREFTMARLFTPLGMTRTFFRDDHAEIIAYALRRLRYKLEYSAAAFQLMPEEFSLSELQHTYEIILGEELDKRNFRRRILEAAIIEPTPRQRTGEGRPARLYRYRPDAVAEVKARRLFP